MKKRMFQSARRLSSISCSGKQHLSRIRHVFGWTIKLFSCNSWTFTATIKDICIELADNNEDSDVHFRRCVCHAGENNAVATQQKQTIPHLEEQQCVAREDRSSWCLGQTTNDEKKKQTLLKNIYSLFYRYSALKIQFKETACATECEAYPFD